MTKLWQGRKSRRVRMAEKRKARMEARVRYNRFLNNQAFMAPRSVLFDGGADAQWEFGHNPLSAPIHDPQAVKRRLSLDLSSLLSFL